MRVSLKWLADYVDVTLSPEELAHKLTMAGMESAAIENIGGDWDSELITVGNVLDVQPHPDADRLVLATVDHGGTEPQTVVCGAPNVEAGQRIAFARAGAKLIDGRSGERAVLKPAKIRGVESAGMVCSGKELGLSSDHEGILVLAADAPVGTALSTYLGDAVLDLDLTPNRPDWMSMLGIAREVAALTGATVREPQHTYDDQADENVPAVVAVEIADPDLCSRYVATVVEGVTLGPSPQWLQERVTAGGMRPINNVVDITNYVMMELGQPLHAFDFSAVQDAKIVVRRAREGEKLTTLDGEERTLTKDMLVIADAKKPVALAGVMGGADSEITEQTTTILLESATFHPGCIRRTAAALRSRTEASARFEKGLSPELAVIAAQRATKLLVELAGGRALHGYVDSYPAPAEEVRIDLTRRRLEQVLGIDLPTSKVRAALTSLGFSVRWSPPELYEVRVPYWRTDVRISDDLAEEVARVIGYDQIPTTNLSGALPSVAAQPLRNLRESLRDACAAAGMQEVITYSLTTQELLARVLPEDEMAARPPLKVAHTVSSEYEYLRPTLWASVLRTAAANLRRHDGELALFEAARVYLPPPRERLEAGELPDEREHVVGVVTGQREDRWGRASDEAVDFFDAKGYVDAALAAVGLTPALSQAERFALLPGRTGAVSVDGRDVGVIGQVHPAVAAQFDIDQDVYVFELVVDELLEVAAGDRVYESDFRYPPVVQDLALVVDRDLPADQVRSAIEQHKLVRAARIFDVYEGEGIADGKKSLALSVTYQAPDRTLTLEEVAKAQDSLLKRLAKEFSAELRA